MKFKILKFGGSSVGSPENIKKVLAIYLSESKESPIKSIVVSAFQGITDQLISLAKQAAADSDYQDGLEKIKDTHLGFVNDLIPATYRARVITQVKVRLDELETTLKGVKIVRELSPRSLDYISSFGERLSAYIISEFFTSQGIKAEFLDLRELVLTDNNFGNARYFRKETEKNIQEYFSKHQDLQIATGFIGSTKSQETTTLGRGGSDYTASILGACLNADKIEIWTDVDGILTADPRKVDQAFPIPELSYEEAMELSHFGAKVIYPPTMVPALEKKIPIIIRNTFNPEFAGSVVSQNAANSSYIVTGITSLPEIALMRIQGSGMVGIAGVATRLFGTLANAGINIILITQASSEHTICFAVSKQNGAQAKAIIDNEFSREIEQKFVDPVVLESDSAIVAVVGERMRSSPGISGRIFKALGRNGINVRAIAQGSSERNISIVISNVDEAKALAVIHDEFFLSDTRTLHIYIAGTGVIGKELIDQISSNRKRLKASKSIDLRINGILNRRSSKISGKGIDHAEALKVINAPQKSAEDQAASSQESSELESFVSRMQKLNLANCVFVDCTADETICGHYSQIIKSGAQMVTANKKSLAGSYERYSQLKSSSTGRLLYETCVGAGLPVISTLTDLINSGDKIIKVEAVLSGTLSFIFNLLDGDTSFSSLVKKAKENGYTEPDPRDDLSGKDVARKLLILARDAGLKIEMEDIKIEDLTPKPLAGLENVDEFMAKLPDFDGEMAQKQKAAEAKDSRLMYVGSFEIDEASGKSKISAGLKEISKQHPFYKLSGRDNIISFTTLRYSDRPLVVQGPGAGASVTAAGVFADILRIAY